MKHSTELLLIVIAITFAISCTKKSNNPAAPSFISTFPRVNIDDYNGESIANVYYCAYISTSGILTIFTPSSTTLLGTGTFQLLIPNGEVADTVVQAYPGDTLTGWSYGLNIVSATNSGNVLGTAQLGMYKHNQSRLFYQLTISSTYAQSGIYIDSCYP